MHCVARSRFVQGYWQALCRETLGIGIIIAVATPGLMTILPRLMVN